MDGTRNASAAIHTDVEAQIGEGLKPPPYTAAEIASGLDAPLVTSDGDDMVINVSGWRVLIRKH
jgi:hypothetical protein